MNVWKNLQGWEHSARSGFLESTQTVSRFLCHMSCVYSAYSYKLVFTSHCNQSSQVWLTYMEPLCYCVYVSSESQQRTTALPLQDNSMCFFPSPLKPKHLCCLITVAHSLQNARLTGVWSRSLHTGLRGARFPAITWKSRHSRRNAAVGLMKDSQLSASHVFLTGHMLNAQKWHVLT